MSYEHREEVLALSWTSYDENLLLAVGTPQNVRVLFQGRTDSDQLNTAWSTLFALDIASISPYPLSGFTFMPGGRLVLCTGTQISTLDLTTADLKRLRQGRTRLPDFHRFHLEQCIVWNREAELQDILARLNSALDGKQEYQALSPESFWNEGEKVESVRTGKHPWFRCISQTDAWRPSDPASRG
jgi:hypothetical protein